MSRMVRDYAELFVLAACALFLAFVLGHAVARSQPVCHSATEDSVITDCEFHDGGWYQK